MNDAKRHAMRHDSHTVIIAAQTKDFLRVRHAERLASRVAPYLIATISDGAPAFGVIEIKADSCKHTTALAMESFWRVIFRDGESWATRCAIRILGLCEYDRAMMIETGAMMRMLAQTTPHSEKDAA